MAGLGGQNLESCVLPHSNPDEPECGRSRPDSTQCGLVVQRIQTARPQRHATSSPHRQVTWQLQKRACSSGPDLHKSRFLRCSNHPAAQAKPPLAARSRVHPHAVPGGVPGLGNRGGDGDLASCCSGESGRIPAPLSSFLEFVGEFKKRATTSLPACQQVSRRDGRRQGLGQPLMEVRQKKQTVGVLARPP